MRLSKHIEKSFPRIEKLFDEKTMLEFLQTPPEDLEKYNVGLGTMIRLKLLRPNNALCQEFIRKGFISRDEMAMEIIKRFHKARHRL